MKKKVLLFVGGIAVCLLIGLNVNLVFSESKQSSGITLDGIAEAQSASEDENGNYLRLETEFTWCDLIGQGTYVKYISCTSSSCEISLTPTECDDFDVSSSNTCDILCSGGV